MERDLLGFTGFYLVLPSFTGFYLVYYTLGHHFGVNQSPKNKKINRKQKKNIRLGALIKHWRQDNELLCSCFFFVFLYLKKKIICSSFFSYFVALAAVMKTPHRRGKTKSKKNRRGRPVSPSGFVFLFVVCGFLGFWLFVWLKRPQRLSLNLATAVLHSVRRIKKA